MVEVSSGDLALAFGLVLAAGFSTALGAALVFCSNLADHRILAGALGASAGVMLYVSFVEIFAGKSISGFVDAGYEDNVAARYATLCFFGGMVVLWILDRVVHGILHLGALLRKNQRRSSTKGLLDPPTPSTRSASPLPAAATDLEAGPPPSSAPGPLVAPTGPSTTAAPSSPSRSSDSSAHHPAKAGCCLHPPTLRDLVAGPADTPLPVAPLAPAAGPTHASDNDRTVTAAGHTHSSHSECEEEAVPIPQGESETVKRILHADHHAALARMGLLSALAIGIHNFPEGLATFVGTLADPRAGVAIAVAIALHNIPEGIVVAMPIYYSTGSKLKGFLWALLSGASEPLGALIGWAILRGNDLDPLVYALMFGLVAGMMVSISLTDLIPTALKYDPEDKFVTKGLVLGMLVMAASLLLFGM